MHASMAARERRYNPGLVTAVALMATHSTLGARALHRSGRRGRLLAAAGGIAFSAGLPAATKLRMRRASPR